MHVFVFYFLLIALSILVYLLFSYSAIRLQECSIKSVSQSVSQIIISKKYIGGGWSLPQTFSL